MSRIVVTGASGVVGHALVTHLKAMGRDVVPLAGRADVNLESFDETLRIFEKHKPSEVYHIAGAVFGLGGNSAFPGDAYRRNVLINTHVVEASRLAGVKKIVAMGSAAMYADQEIPFFREEDVMKNLPHKSEQAYGFAKRGLLVQLEAYRQQFGLDFAFAIATNMYGPHDRFDPRYGHVIPSLITKFASAGPDDIVEIWGDGSPTRDFLYAADAAKGLSLMMEKGEGPYNLATGQSVRIADLVTVLSELFPKTKYRWDTTKPLGQLARSYATDRLATLGFVPDFNLRQGLEETVRWFNANQDVIRRYV